MTSLSHHLCNTQRYTNPHKAFWRNLLREQYPTDFVAAMAAISRSQRSDDRNLTALAAIQRGAKWCNTIQFRKWWKTARAHGATVWYALDVALWYGVIARVEPV